MTRTVSVLSAVALCLAAGCGSARRSAPIVPEYTITDPKVREGEVAFAQMCNSCHPGGAAGLAPAINNKPLPAFAIKAQVRQGLGAMPAFKESVLPDAKLDAVVEYLKFLRALEPRDEAVDD